MKNRLYIVIPCYNETEVLDETSKQLGIVMKELINKGSIAKDSKVLYVNDGSKDDTWDKIENYVKKDSLFAGVCLSRNRGHQNALLAGLMVAKDTADITISMDADLQDDLSVIPKMLEQYNNGCDVVYGVRSSRKKDTFFKRFTAQSFYKFMKMLGVDVIYNHADCRLMSKRALEGLNEYKEVNLFLRGIVPQIGYKSSIVYYERNERFAGESKYPLKKMISFAVDGVTSFSVKPLSLIFETGFIGLLMSFIALITMIVLLILNKSIASLFWIIWSVFLMGNIELIAFGIIGVYIGKIYYETKERPRYLIKDIIGLDDNLL